MNDSRHDNVIFATAELPELLHAPVQRWFEKLAESGVEIADPPATLIRLVASSEFAAGVLLRDWDWFFAELVAGALDNPYDERGAAGFASEIGVSEEDVRIIKARLRQFRDRSLVRILWRVANGQDDAWETLYALSDLADALIAGSMEYASRLLTTRFGQPVNQQGDPIPAVVLAMGKLGGGELNFSSDVDLIFLYTEEGETDGARSLSAHEFFTRFSRQVVALLDEVTENGFVYRVDTRLRPFGDSGPTVVNFAALESYLLQHGRGWERYAYIKARMISPAAATADLVELQTDIIDPFVYRRYLDYGVFESLRDMKALIEAEVRKRELAGNIKLGPGGIREIEFIVQSLQLVRGGADQELRCRELRQALSRLGHARGLGRKSVATLLSAYEFLRRFENAVQAIRDQQTHEVPTDPADRARLTLVMGFKDWDALLADLVLHRANVSRQFAEVAFRGEDGANETELAATVATQWTRFTADDEWLTALRDEGFEDVSRLASALEAFANAPVQRQIDVTARKRLDRFMLSFLGLLKHRKRAGAVCERVLSVVSQVVRRSAYVALLNENPAVLGRLVDLCDQSAYLAGEIARYPLLLDELLDPRLYSAHISASNMREDLDGRLKQVDPADSERMIETLAQFQRTTLFRIAVADVSGNLPIMKVSDRLTELAEIVLNEALGIAWTDLVTRHGEPESETQAGKRKAGFGVIAYGKLGGMELSYRSDLDLVFLHDSHGPVQVTNGEKPLDNSMFFGRLVRRLVHFLTAQTDSGALYEVDTRLRPSGQSGLLVVSTDGFEKYQEENAWTWEHQALLRSRPVAGSAAVAREFERIRVATLRNRVRRDKLLGDVLSMRQKMREQLDKSSSRQFDLKQGVGGIGDIEFLVQYLVLRNAGAEPSLVHYPDNIRQLGVLEAVGCLTAEDVACLQDAYKSYRLRTHRLSLDGKPPLVPITEFVVERDFVCAVWQREMKSPR
jgi:glutamate-ammonia-ligase adenylyltransferase